ncbi:hypothetical protein FGO68_gene7751 [Halteria grandinella]|uniref:Uncharacterized protein n=1 Tax=Halteria grandinella TaxID=5974 RepID=A0A8J8NGH2_HALGN|nr:hypothetical protein FGO68_gene7751 [Halteria grandinella]
MIVNQCIFFMIRLNMNHWDSEPSSLKILHLYHLIHNNRNHMIQLLSFLNNYYNDSFNNIRSLKCHIHNLLDNQLGISLFKILVDNIHRNINQTIQLSRQVSYLKMKVVKLGLIGFFIKLLYFQDRAPNQFLILQSLILRFINIL